MKKLLVTVLVLSVLVIGTSAGLCQNKLKYDMILKGGHVIDPANNINGKMDVAILDGKIAAVSENIPESTAKALLGDDGAIKVVDVSGYYITPGLIDIHTHVWPLEEYINPRDHNFSSGVTTVCDAGSMGANGIEEAIDFYWDDAGNIKGGFWMPRVLFFLNITANAFLGNTSISQHNIPLAVEIAKKYPGIIVGYKSYGRGDFEGDPWFNVDAAIEAGRQAGIPVMFDYQPTTGRPYDELITKKMRPGDIHTHYTAMQFPLIMSDGKLNPAVVSAQKRGVIFDVGHGSGSVVFRNAVRSIEQGLIPNSISTDLHGRNTNSPVFNMTNVMSKFLCMGRSLEDVIRLSTVNPASEIQHTELGTLSVGAPAEIAVLEQLNGTFSYTDSSPGQDLTGGGRLHGDKKLQCVMTIFGGNVVHDITGLTYRDWEDIPEDDPYWFGQSGEPVMGIDPVK